MEKADFVREVLLRWCERFPFAGREEEFSINAFRADLLAGEASVEDLCSAIAKDLGALGDASPAAHLLEGMKVLYPSRSYSPPPFLSPPPPPLVMGTVVRIGFSNGEFWLLIRSGRFLFFEKATACEFVGEEG